MGQHNKLVQKIIKLNTFTEQTENWFICLKLQTFQPPEFEKRPERFFIKYDNVIVASNVEFYGFGKIQKVVTIGSDKYKLTEVPEVILHTILNGIFSDGETHLNPEFFILDQNSETPKVRLVAQWWPETDYFKVLKEKRGFMTEQEFEMIKPLLTGVYEEHGVKPPNYITENPFSQVPEKIH